MKHATLHSIAHNLGDSFACGIGLLIGSYDLDIYHLAAKSQNGRISCDFLNSAVVEGALDTKHRNAFERYCEALPKLAASQGASLSDFSVLILTFWAGKHFGLGFDADVADHAGKRSVRSYRGIPAKTPMVIDPLGRLRPQRPKRTA